MVLLCLFSSESAESYFSQVLCDFLFMYFPCALVNLNTCLRPHRMAPPVIHSLVLKPMSKENILAAQSLHLGDMFIFALLRIEALMYVAYQAQHPFVLNMYVVFSAQHS